MSGLFTGSLNTYNRMILSGSSILWAILGMEIVVQSNDVISEFILTLFLVWYVCCEVFLDNYLRRIVIMFEVQQ
jgi:hypothetical protein